MKYYHFTDKKIYDKILTGGKLEPYRFNTAGDPQKRYLVRRIRMVKKNGKGIYVWKKMDTKLCADFYYYQRLTNNVKEGVILELEISNKSLLLSVKYEKEHRDNIMMKHSFVGGVLFHKNVEFDIYLGSIPLDHIKLIMEVSLKIKTY